MNTHILSFFCGFLTVFVLIALVFAIYRKRHALAKYDERQLMEQGNSYKVGFFTLLLTDSLVSALDLLEYLPGAPFVWHICCLALGIAAFAVTAIWKHAYIGINETPTKFLRIGLLFVISMVCSAWSNLSHPDSFSLSVAAMNLCVAGIWALIVIALFIRIKLDKAEDAE